ncbi:MAG: type II secretion system protein GspD, partial [Planctomycetaceae bacterium]
KLEEALDAILTINGYTWVRRGDILMVSAVSEDSSALPLAQGRLMRVFPLSFASAVEADKVVKGLLSPIGQSFVTESSSLDKRKTQESIVVEDLPEYLARIEAYLCQIDQPPRQVLIEAHVLQVDLSDDSRNGVDFGQILEIAETGVTLQTRGFTSALANPAFFFGIEGEDMTSVIEALQSTTDAKTLASPKVFAVNGQEARIQIGGRFGYFVTTTTQTSTLQSVEFLEVGVVLRVTPIISEDNQILMTVMPEVSNGRVNRDTGLPEEETTEVQTTVLLPDGQAMIIGGLLRETDRDVQSKPPFLGDLWLVGRLFQRRAAVRERTEIIIALRPRIVPCPELQEPREQLQTLRARTPLFTPGLRRIDRRLLEPGITDAMRRPLDLWRPELLHPARWFGPPPPNFPLPGPPHGPPAGASVPP